MIRETYKGRSIKVTKGRQPGYSRVAVNGADQGDWLETQQQALAGVKRTIDHADQVGVIEARYGAEWYAPGTYDLCPEGHVMPIGGQCGHAIWISGRQVTCAQRAVQAVAQ